MRKDRTEMGCRNTKSKNGTFTPHIATQTAERLTKYCHLTNINRTKFVEQCINKQLDWLEKEYYESLTKDDLIALVMGK